MTSPAQGGDTPRGVPRTVLGNLWDAFVEVAIPMAASMWIFFEIEERAHLQERSRLLFIFVWVFVLTAGSTLFGAAISWWRQSEAGKRTRESRRIHPMLRFLLASFMVPLVIAVSLAIVPVIGSESLLTYLLKRWQQGSEQTLLTQIRKAVLDNQDLETKVEGVITLGKIRSPQALTSLFDILRRQTPLLEKHELYSELSNALAAFDTQSSPGLIAFFREEDEKRRRTPGTGDLHRKYFEPSFQALKKEVEGNPRSEETRKAFLERLNQIELRLEQELRNAGQGLPDLLERETSLEFVLDTFLDFDSSESTEIHALARQVAGDDRYAPHTRARAILLIAKFGSPEDLPVLQEFIGSKNATLRTAGLTAVGNLHEKEKKATKGR